MRSVIYAVIIVVMIGSCLVAITANNNADELRQSLNQERYTRMVTEEKLQKANSRIKSIEDQLAETQNKIKSVQTILQEGQSTNTDLKTQLENVTQTKNSLEKRIEDLVNRIQQLEKGASSGAPANGEAPANGGVPANLKPSPIGKP